jgi:hypothetical protein
MIDRKSPHIRSSVRIAPERSAARRARANGTSAARTRNGHSSHIDWCAIMTRRFSNNRRRLTGRIVSGTLKKNPYEMIMENDLRIARTGTVFKPHRKTRRRPDAPSLSRDVWTEAASLTLSIHGRGLPKTSHGQNIEWPSVPAIGHGAKITWHSSLLFVSATLPNLPLRTTID